MINGILQSVSLIINNEFAFILIILSIMFLFERKETKRKKIMLALFLAILLGGVMRELIAVERPCIQINGLIECPYGHSLPSVHSIAAFTLAIAFMDRKEYPILLAFALLVGWTRIYLGVHTVYDVTAALALSPICYGLVDFYWRRKNG
ncbi:phosphatase PAP2 family protein [Candidatus Micrarchaeota archaeon]|nr:phosphatase PAP2 family protein [Candidatus Micrarchaeota archaeon]